MPLSATYDAADRLTAVNGVAYTYDANGNQLSDGKRIFTYDSANRLTRVVSGTLTTQYAYSGDGVRRAQIVNGVETRYLVDVAAPLPQVLQESKSGATTRYLYGLGLIGTQDSGTWAYQQADGLGSLRQMSNSAGQVVQTRSYTPFGAVKTAVGSAPGSFGFAGEQQDAAQGTAGSDLVFLRARYYDPSTGRFLTRDPYPAYATEPGTLHRYTYARNDPVNLIDPSGLDPEGFSMKDNFVTRAYWHAMDQVSCAVLGVANTLNSVVNTIGRGIQQIGDWVGRQVDYTIQAIRQGDWRMATSLMVGFGSRFIMAGVASASVPIAMLVGAGVGLFALNVVFQTQVYGTPWGTSLAINSLALMTGMFGANLGGSLIGGVGGKLLGAAIGGGLGQIGTNLIDHRPWDEGLLFNMGLATAMEGVGLGAEHVVGWAADRLSGLTQRVGNAIDRFGGWASDKLETIRNRGDSDSNIGWMDQVRAEKGSSSTDQSPSRFVSNQEFTKKAYEVLERTKAGQRLLKSLQGESPEVFYADMSDIGIYERANNRIILNEKYLLDIPELAAPSLAHELTHRSRRWAGSSALDEYHSFFVEQKVWRQILSTDEINEKTLWGHGRRLDLDSVVRQAKLDNFEFIEGGALWNHVADLYGDLPSHAENTKEWFATLSPDSQKGVRTQMHWAFDGSEDFPP